MSGFVGILHGDGAPVSLALLRQLTAGLRFRGPDGESIWCEGAAGFGHAQLKTTPEQEQEHQPFTLDGKVWIAADARVDDRAGLVRELASAVLAPELALAPDVELILRAYLHWGEVFLDHLLGDFAFAIWDAAERRLFAARDPLGVKPFYYAHAGATLLISNTLDSLRLHPGVSSAFNEEAIADLLLFDMNQNPATTSFAGIASLPAAHALRWTPAAGCRTWRYWSLPVEEPLRLPRAGDYVERFQELIETAIADRVRGSRVAVHMSGGLDSTCAAAVASRLGPVEALTVVYDPLLPDQERHYAGIAAGFLGIPIHFLAADGYKAFQEWNSDVNYYPELLHDPHPALGGDQSRRAAGLARVAFFCEGADNGLHYDWQPYLKRMARQGQWGQLTRDLGNHLRLRRRLPLLGRLRRTDNFWPQTDAREGPAYPPWLNPGFAARLQLRERWQAARKPATTLHPYRPEAYASFGLAHWRCMLERFDPGFTGARVETRYPFLDVRLLRFLLTLPPIPWCADKYIVREAMRGRLPEPVRLRPKTALAGDPITAGLLRGDIWPAQAFEFAPELADYVSVGPRWRDGHRDGKTVWENWTDLRPISLACGLQRLRQRRPAPRATLKTERMEDDGRETTQENLHRS